MKRPLLATCAVLAGLLQASVANAQQQLVPQSDTPQWLKDRRTNEGQGFRTGDVEFHLGIAGEFGYDSNWFTRSNRNGVDNGPMPADMRLPAAPIVPALEYRISPSVYVSTLSAVRREGDAQGAMPTVNFRAGVNATYRDFSCLGSNCSGNNDISQQRNVSAAVEAKLDVLPERPVNFSLNANYARAVLPNFTTADPNLQFTNDAIGVGAELGLQDGLLDWHFGYQLRAVLYEEAAGQGFNSVDHTVSTRGRWRLLPRTALIYDGSIGFDSYANPDQAILQGLVNSMPVRSRIGLNGLVTDRFGVLVMGGYGATFNDTSTNIVRIPQYDGILLQAELRWYLSANPGSSPLSELGLTLSSIAAGYTHDFTGSLLGDYYGIDRGYLKFNYLFASRVVLSLEGGVGAIEYPTMYFQNTPPMTGDVLRHNAFTDIRVDGTLFGEYRLTDFLGLNATIRYTQNISSVHDLPDINGEPLSVFDMEWNRIEAFIGVRAFW